MRKRRRRWLEPHYNDRWTGFQDSSAIPESLHFQCWFGPRRREGTRHIARLKLDSAIQMRVENCLPMGSIASRASIVAFGPRLQLEREALMTQYRRLTISAFSASLK